MTHVRQQIREAFCTALASVAGGRVFKSRVYPLEQQELPGCLVSAASEVSAAGSMGVPRLMNRTARLQVRIVAAENADVDDVLDSLCADVEAALAMPCAALAGLAQVVTLTSTDIRLTGAGMRPLGSAELTYDVQYRTTENAPTVAR